MPEHLRALVVILAIAATVFWLAEKPLCEAGVDPSDYKRRRNIWFALTLIAFLAHSFWLYVAIAVVVIVVGGWRERNPLALYVVLLFAVPPMGAKIPGLGVINYVFDLDHIRLLNLVLLLPMFFSRSQDSGLAARRWSAAEWSLLAYLALLAGLIAILSSFTGTMRAAFLLLIDVWVPFFAAARSLHNIQRTRDVALSLALSGMVLAGIALFEALKHWLLFSQLNEVLGIPWGYGSYLLRGESGPLRALASTGHSIVLGYVLMVSVGLYAATSLGERVSARSISLATLLLAGLVASLSRGPWIGALAMVVVLLALGRDSAGRLAKALAVLVVTGGIAAVSPWGAAIIDYLPFVGTVDVGSVDYRTRLVEVSLAVLWNNPAFGVWDYMLNPAMEEMRQGQGIIDMVNSYLGVALNAGLVGLTLFLAPFAIAAWKVQRRRLAALAEGDEAVELLGRSLLATLLGVAVTIGTVSSINAVPTIYWLLAGMMVSYSAFAPAVARRTPVRERAAAPAARGAVGAPT